MSIANTNGTKSLGRKELVAMAVGNIIGGGVMTMTGIAIGITGTFRFICLYYQCGPCAYYVSATLFYSGYNSHERRILYASCSVWW